MVCLPIDINADNCINIIIFNLFTSFLFLLFVKYWHVSILYYLNLLKGVVAGMFSFLGCFSFRTNILQSVYSRGLVLLIDSG